MAIHADERYEVKPIDVRSSSEDELQASASVMGAVMRERVSEDPETSLAYRVRSIRATPDSFERRDWIARDGGTAVGRAVAWRRLYGDKQNVRNSEIEVLPDHRRRGLARAFLHEIVRTAADDDSALFGFITTDRIPGGESFLRRAGAEPGMVMTTNQVDLASVDRALLAAWREARPAGYRLEWIDGDVPEYLLDNVVAAYAAMAATPTGTLRIWDFTATPEVVRSYESARQEQGREHALVLAIDEATGETAGFTEASWHPEQSYLIRQGGTAVTTKHQGRGVGKWLKALLLERILAEHPQARYMRTNNNPVNAPIIAINERLGFRPAWTNTIWQLPIAGARRYLQGSTA
ncbi:MAG: GNAT family N-acetyltransferase [Candidatus Limnocylindria bacterium]